MLRQCLNLSDVVSATRQCRDEIHEILPVSPRTSHLLTCPLHGLPLDPLALRLCFDRRESDRVRLLRSCESWRRRKNADRPSWPALLHHPECVSLYAWTCDDRPLRTFGRAAKTSARSCR